MTLFLYFVLPLSYLFGGYCVFIVHAMSGRLKPHWWEMILAAPWFIIRGIFK